MGGRVVGVSTDARIAEFEALVVELRAEIEVLRSENAELRARWGKDSGNSSSPPSRDGRDRRTRRAEEREARKQARIDGGGGVDRKPGKQPGAPGATLQRRRADRTVTHAPGSCVRCAASLIDAPVVGTATRQVLDIPPPRVDVTDHVVEKRRCSCGHVTSGAFPAEATAPTCWGPRIKAVAVYLMIRQHIPLERAHEAVSVLFDAPLSEGTLAGLSVDAAERLAPFMTELAALIRSSAVVCADETSCKTGRSTSWVHTASTSELTLLAHHARRGIDAIIAIGVLPGYRGVIMHDGLATYDRTELAEASHAQCAAHLARHLTDVGTYYKHTAWTTAMRSVLHDAKRASEHAANAGLTAVPAPINTAIRARYQHTLDLADAALPTGSPPKRRNRGGWFHRDRDAWNLAQRFRHEHDQILRLLNDTRIPADNNEAERSLRMCKLHDKIAGCFRNPRHAEAFCTIRSYIQTGQKQGQNTLDNLTRLYTDTPWLPTS